MLAPSGGGLILYQAYGNLYAIKGRKAHLLEDKQIPSVGVFDEMAFGGNKRDLGSFREETDKITDLHQIHEEVLFTERGDGVACIKRRRHDLSSDGVRHSCTGHQVLFYCLIGSIYKIIAKILANRLSLVIPDLISELQTAFVPNRQILDGPFILNELISWCKHKKVNAMIFKVDFEKAFDSVRWEYLDDILKSFGFGDTWRSWISCCLNFANGSVLINGSPTSEFQFHKGLKQGDTLSSFLFILVMESLHRSFSKVMEAGLFKGIRVSKAETDLAASIMGCSTFSPPFHYLEVKLEHLCLESFRRRKSLTKSLLDFLPLYYMSIYKAPVAVLKDLEFIRRDFFNGVDKVDRKIAWVRWEKVLASKNNVRELVVGALVVGELVGKLVVGELVVGDLVGELVVGELIVGDLMVREQMSGEYVKFVVRYLSIPSSSSICCEVLNLITLSNGKTHESDGKGVVRYEIRGLFRLKERKISKRKCSTAKTKPKDTLKFYRKRLGFKRPSRVLVDGPVLYFITVNKLSLKDIKEVLNDDQAQFVTTNCVLREMEVFYHKYSGSAQMLKSIEVAKAFDVVPCMHQKEVSAEQCIRSVVGIKNSCKMFVAVVANCSWPLLHKDPTIPIIIADNKTFGLKQLSSREQRLAKKWCADYPIEK
ncbi:RNA-directed DNA polymerase, eukaryota, partial [Tanacetum coccineum]